MPQGAPLDPIHAKALFKALPTLASFERSGVLQTQAAIAGETVYDIYGPANGLLEYVYIGRPDGSSTVIQYDTENQHSWSVAMFDANPQGQLVDVTVDNPDGSYSKEYFDAQLPGDPETQLDYVNADGTWKAYLYDPGNTQRWSSEVQYFTAAGQETTATLSLRTGGTEDQAYDLAHGDALQTDTTYNPDGTVNQWAYDTAGVNGWYKYLYNAAGTVQLSQAYYDRNGNTEVLAWDPAHGDVLQTDTTYAATGTHQVMYDTAGVNGWWALISDWNALGQLVDQSWSERDGASNTEFYSNGVLSSNVTIGAGGEKAEASYNSTGTAVLLFDEEGRTIYKASLTPANALVLSTPAGYSLLGTKWYDTHSLGVSSFHDTAGDIEGRFINSAGQIAGLEDVYTDGTSNVTLVSIAA